MKNVTKMIALALLATFAFTAADAQVYHHRRHRVIKHRRHRHHPVVVVHHR